jgi:hypothetical protein
MFNKRRIDLIKLKVIYNRLNNINIIKTKELINLFILIIKVWRTQSTSPLVVTLT